MMPLSTSWDCFKMAIWSLETVIYS
jgi:hypothetical protein